MCPSARVWQDYRKYVRAYGAEMSIQDFIHPPFLAAPARGASKVKVAQATEAAFEDSQSDAERQVAAIAEFAAGEATRLEQELFKQRTRLVAAERELQAKVTKKASKPNAAQG